jgi:putative endonuclease
MSHETRAKGQAAEDLAARYLSDLGYRVLKRNYRTRNGEIDLVAEDPEGAVLVFIEVKSGDGTRFPGFYDSIGARKLEKIAQVAAAYIENSDRRDGNFRVDAVFIEKGGETPRVIHLKHVGFTT